MKNSNDDDDDDNDSYQDNVKKQSNLSWKHTHLIYNHIISTKTQNDTILPIFICENIVTIVG